MKKSTLIVLGVVVVIALIAIIVISSSNQEQDAPVDPNLDNGEITGGLNPAPTPDPIPEPEPIEPEPVEIPEPETDDIVRAIVEPSDEAELKFLTETQKEELNSATISRTNPTPRPDQKYTIEWANTDITELMPPLEEEAPLYILDRPEDKSIYKFIIQIGQKLGIEGAVLRMNEQDFTIANIATGDTFMNYDLYHLTYTANDLEVEVDGEGIDAVEKAMAGAGLLGFDYTSEEHQDEAGNTWYRFVPDLPLPAISFADSDMVTDAFEPGQAGVVDVAVEGNTITEIIANFPNIRQKGIVDVADAEGIASAVVDGEFRLGHVELQYPGPLSIEEKRAFFDDSRQEQIDINEAELSVVDCGYILEDDETVQALLAPSCVAYGKGKLNERSVLFKVAFPVVD
jgi:hypothetical protein